MNRLANSSRREYRSDLRAEQAEETRSRIMDATVRVMAGGVASVSIPAVAREAGVSVPTVYRHFRTKPDLLAALYPHLVSRVGLYEMTPPSSVEEFRTTIRAIFDRLDAFDDLTRAAVASPAAEQARSATMPDRLRMSRQLVESMAPDLSGSDHDRIARVMVILTTSASLRTWRDHVGASVDDATDDVEWALRSLIAASTRPDR
jgi:AcrR family transcriptional regulator